MTPHLNGTSGRSARESRERSAIWPVLFFGEPNRASERVGESEGRRPSEK
jgi:hypothetical protein